MLIIETTSNNNKRKSDPPCGESKSQKIGSEIPANERRERPGLDHLENGNTREDPILVHNYNIIARFINTCAFDANVEIFAHCYKALNQFKYAIDRAACNNKFFSFIASYAQRGIYAEIYSLRAEILLEFYTENTHYSQHYGCPVVDCWSNIMSKLSHTLCDELDPSIEVRTCFAIPSCATLNQPIANIAVPISNAEIMEFGFTRLEALLNNVLTVGEINQCGQCFARNSCQVQRRPSSMYLCLDVQDCFITEEQRLTNSQPLGAYPVNIQASNTNYTLMGAVEYRHGHYIAHCRFLDNTWLRRDDLEDPAKGPTKGPIDDSAKRAAEQLAINQSLSCVYLFYVNNS